MVLQVLNVTYFITNTVIRMPGKMQHLRSCLPHSVNCQASSTVKNAKGMNGLLPGVGTRYIYKNNIGGATSYFFLTFPVLTGSSV